MAAKAIADEAAKPVRRKVQIVEEDSESESDVEFEDEHLDEGGPQEADEVSEESIAAEPVASPGVVML